MGQKIQLRRGLSIQLPTLDNGELGFCTDTKEVYIGTPSGNQKITSFNEVSNIASVVMPKTTWKNVSSPVKIAHRGDLVTAPENTMAAYRNCYAWNAPIKLDVLRSADYTLLSMHDNTVDRTTDGTGSVASMYLTKLMGLDAGSKFDSAYAKERIPLIREVFKRYSGLLMIADCKTASVAVPLAKMIQEFSLQPYVIFEGTNFNDIQAARAIDPSIIFLRGYLVTDSLTTAVSDMVANGVTWCAVDFTNSGFNSAFVQSCHNAGIKVITFNIGNLFDKGVVDAFGVDGYYIEDYPYVAGLYSPAAFQLPYSDSFNGKSYFGTGWGVTNNANDVPFSYGGGFIGRTTYNNTFVAGATIKNFTLPSTVTINVTITPKQLNADTSRYAGLQICLQQDKLMMSSFPTPSGMNGYWFSFREDGTMQIDKDVSGSNFSTIASKATAAMVLNTPIPVQIAITPTSITMTRTDTGDSITTTDATYRGGRLAFINGGMAAQFSSYSMS